MAIPMTAILSLGSNLGNRLAHLVQAREALAHLPQTRLVASSRVYVTELVNDLINGAESDTATPPENITLNVQRSTPNAQPNIVQARPALDRWALRVECLTLKNIPSFSNKHSPNFFNAIVILETTMEVHVFSAAVHAIETRLGRKRTVDRNAPRVIDLDLICCDGLQLDEPALQLPHPRAHLRRFVCEPLTELRPDLVLPGQQHPMRAILAHLPVSPGVSIAAEQW